MSQRDGRIRDRLRSCLRLAKSDRARERCRETYARRAGLQGAGRYHCVAFVHGGKVSGWLSCTTKHDRAIGHLTALQAAGMKSVEIVTRASKPPGVKAPPKGRPRTQGSLFDKPKANQGQLFGRRRRRS